VLACVAAAAQTWGPGMAGAPLDAEAGTPTAAWQQATLPTGRQHPHHAHLRLQVCLEYTTQDVNSAWYQWASAECDPAANPCCPKHGLAFSTASCAVSGPAKGVGFLAVGELRCVLHAPVLCTLLHPAVCAD
jgi:hypothetical protein